MTVENESERTAEETAKGWEADKFKYLTMVLRRQLSRKMEARRKARTLPLSGRSPGFPVLVRDWEDYLEELLNQRLQLRKEAAKLYPVLARGAAMEVLRDEIERLVRECQREFAEHCETFEQPWLLGGPSPDELSDVQMDMNFKSRDLRDEALLKAATLFPPREHSGDQATDPPVRAEARLEVEAIAAVDQLRKNAVKKRRIEFDDEGRVVPVDPRPQGPAQLKQLKAFSDLTLVFTSDHAVQIAFPGYGGGVHTYQDLGFEDKRSKLPNKAWKLLFRIALNGGCLDRNELRNVATSLDAGEHLLREARRRLEALFTCKDNPIPWVKKNKAYRAAFHIGASDFARE